jgi:hypothetical protein
MSRTIIRIEGKASIIYIDLESITSIKSYYENILELAPKVKRKWWDILGLFTPAYKDPQGREVRCNFMGVEYIITGKREKMMLYFSSGKHLEIDWDTDIYAKWMKFGQ